MYEMMFKDPEMREYTVAEAAYGQRYAWLAEMYTENGFVFDTLPLLETMNSVIGDVEKIIGDLELGRDDKIAKLKSIEDRINDTERGSWLRFKGTEEELEVALNNLNENLDERDWYTREFDGNAIEIKCWVVNSLAWSYGYPQDREGFLFELQLDLTNFGGNTVYKRSVQLWEDKFGELRYTLAWYW